MTSPTGGFKIAEGYVEVVTRVDRSDIKAAGREAAAEFEAALTPEFTAAGTRSGRSFSTQVSRTGETALRDSRSTFARVGEEIGQSVGTSVGTKFGDTLSQAGSTVSAKLSGIGSDISSKFGKVLGILVGLVKPAAEFGAALEYIPPIINAIAGGIASLPALLAGAVGALGVLGLGFHGLGGAISAALSNGSSGGGGSSGIDQTAAAERRLASAQRDAADAQQNLNDAREQAAKDIRDLNTELNRSYLDEAEAQLGVLEAQRQLLLARADTSDPYAVARAQLALREANQTLIEAKQRTSDLSEEQQDASVKGVEGSDRVQQALRQQADAVQAVADAEDALRQARQGGSGGGVSLQSALAGLAPSARAFVEEIKKVKPEFKDLQLLVQQNLFAGWDQALDHLVSVWMPHLRTGLGGLAASFNGLGKNLAQALEQPSVTGAFDRALASFGGFLDRLGPHLPGLADAFAKLSDAALPFLEALGDKFIRGIDAFSKFIRDKDKDGSLGQWFKDAAKNASDLIDDIKEIGKIVVDSLSVLLDNTNKGAEQKPPLEQLHDDLVAIDDWINSDEGKQTIKDTKGFLSAVAELAAYAAKGVVFLVTEFDRFANWLADHKKSSKKDLDAIGDAFNDTAGRIVGAFDWISSRVTSALHAVRDAARDAFNQVSRIPGFSALGSLIGKYFHDGGITSGGIRYAAAGLTTFGPNSGAVYSRPVYGIAEPGTGGELFMPRFGNQQRQQMLAGVAAAWAGGAYVPAQQVGSPVATIPTDSMQPSIVHVHLMVDGKELGKGAVLDLRAVSAAAAAGDRLSNATNTGRRR